MRSCHTDSSSIHFIARRSPRGPRRCVCVCLHAAHLIGFYFWCGFSSQVLTRQSMHNVYQRRAAGGGAAVACFKRKAQCVTAHERVQTLRTTSSCGRKKGTPHRVPSSLPRPLPTVPDAPAATLESAGAPCGSGKGRCAQALRPSSGWSTWSRASARSPSARTHARRPPSPGRSSPRS